MQEASVSASTERNLTSSLLTGVEKEVAKQLPELHTPFTVLLESKLLLLNPSTRLFAPVHIACAST